MKYVNTQGKNMEVYDTKAAIRLASEIIKEACNDYLIAYKDYKYSKNKEYAKYKLDRAEKWFYTEHASNLMIGITAEELVERLDKMAENEQYSARGLRGRGKNKRKGQRLDSNNPLRSIRIKNGHSLRDVGLMIDISESQLSLIERGLKEVNDKVKEKLSKYYTKEIIEKYIKGVENEEMD